MECATPPVETPMFERSIRFWCVCGSSARQSPPQRRPMRCEHLDGRLIVQIVCDEISVHEEYPTFFADRRQIWCVRRNGDRCPP